MAKTKQEQANVVVATEIQNFSPTEMEIYDLFQEKGFAVAHIDEHRNLWEWSQKNNCGVYIGRRRIPTDPSAGNADNKWANPYKLDTRFPADGQGNFILLPTHQ